MDRLPPRKVLVIGNLTALALLASVPVAAWAGVLSLAQLLVVALLLGVASMFSQTAYQVFLPSVVPAEDLARANSRVQGSASVALIAGPGAGGLLVQLLGAVNALIADVASFAACALCLLGVRTPDSAPARPENRNLSREIRTGLRFVARDPFLRGLTLYSAAGNMVDGAREAILIVFLVRTVGVDPAGVGVLIASMGAGGVLGAFLSSRIANRLGTARAILLAELCAIPFVLLIPLTTAGAGLAYFVAGRLVVSAGVTVSNVVIGSFRQSYCPRELLGRVVAAGRFLAFGAIPIGAVLGGALGTGLGVRETMWILACAQILCVGILLAGPLRKVRELPVRCETVTALDG
ncbi:MFS transporter [Amycolatopsis sp. H20-H5]|uniref:MFS transporter n=1 Tax=Amycolatopsis sp. H20-H5 TaxID=3046309 RepID=UPI002DBF5D64|nr:MFS transporter [Amycolatopsis sp. H20-H5]MEC3979962.1 MFS transporter [Amycolatopsis sp. H20-H5]